MNHWDKNVYKLIILIELTSLLIEQEPCHLFDFDSFITR